ncbi:BQ2448_7818 [Microbotryum intermedium]|uniref:BQ2448_7818 protein n=1 Tax=Microbotryum intermedium TaxID=269621 RepID=A0A238FPU6_9BASI|nr:BQ2448_7818 [Microbotryum intermedium]
MASDSNDDKADHFNQLALLSNPSNLPPPTPVPKLDRSLVLALHQALIDRERAWAQSKSTSTEARQRKEVVGPYKPWSRRGSKGLQFVEGLHALRCDESAKGKALLVRIISHTVVNAISVHFVIEDICGDVAPVQLYRLPRKTPPQDLNDQFPQGATFVISEPTLRSSKHGFLIRIDSPADFRECLNPPYVQESPFENPNDTSTPHQHQLEGEAYLEQGRSQAALRSFALALDRAWKLGKDELLASLGYHQSRAFDQAGQYRNCIFGTEGAFQTARSFPQQLDPSGEVKKNTLWLGAKAAYRLQEWDHVERNLANLKEVQERDEEMVELERKVGRRIEENRDGTFEWDDLFEQARKGKDLDASDHRHPALEVREIEGKGAGVVARSKIERGALVLFEEALATAEAPSISRERGGGGGSSTVCVNLFTREYDTEALGQVVAVLLDRMDGDERVKKIVYELSAGPAEAVLDELRVERREEDGDGPDEDDNYDYDDDDDDEYDPSLPLGLDVSRVEAIVTYNAFKIRSMAQPEADYKTPAKTDRLALYNFTSRFNHSCLPNVSYQFLGDRILLRAMKTIEEGEELVISYKDSMRSFEERRKHQGKHGFVCGCRLCALDKKEEKGKVVERRSLIRRVEGLDEKESDDLDAYLDLVRQIERTYAPDRPKSLRPELFRPLTIVAERLARSGRLEQAIGMQRKALEGIGAQFAPSTEVMKRFPMLGDEENVKMGLRIADKYQAMGGEESKRMVGVWMDNARRMEEGEAGRVLFERRYRGWVGEMGMRLDLK